MEWLELWAKIQIILIIAGIVIPIIFIIAALIPFSERMSAALIASATIRPVATITTSVPSFTT